MQKYIEFALLNCFRFLPDVYPPIPSKLTLRLNKSSRNFELSLSTDNVQNSLKIFLSLIYSFNLLRKKKFKVFYMQFKG